MPEIYDNAPTAIAMPPMTDEEGAEYAREETMDGHYATTDTRD